MVAEKQQTANADADPTSNDEGEARQRQQQSDQRRVIGWRPKALDGGYGWIVVLGSFLIHVFADGFVYSFGVIAESLIEEFHSTNTEASAILSLLTGLMLAAGPLASAICNRIGCRVTTIIGALVASVGCALSYFAYSMTYLVLSVGIVMGTGFGLMYCPAIVIVTMYFEKYRSLATGVTVCGAGVGTFVFSKVISILIVHFNWRTVFIIYAAVVLLCVPCGALFKPIEFLPLYNDEEEMEEELGKNKDEEGLLADVDQHQSDVVHDEPVPSTDAIQSIDQTHHRPDGLTALRQLRPAHSHQLINRVAANGTVGGAIVDGEPERTEGGGVLQRFFSIGDRLHEASKRGDAVSVSTGYLNFKDVFYPGSITELPEYKEQKMRFRSVSSLHSHASSTLHPIAGQNTAQPVVTDRIEEERDEEVELETAGNDGVIGVGGGERKRGSSGERIMEVSTTSSRAIEIWRTVKRMLDLSLLADPVYLLFGISNFLTSIGFNAPPMFMPMNAETVLGWDKIQASSTVSAYGLANTLGRIAFGLICDRSLPSRWGKDRARNRLWIYNLTLMFCGIISCLVFSLTSFYTFIAYCFLFGFTISSYVCLTSVVLVDLVGVDRLTNAFGLLLFIQGIATFVGPPLAGKLFDLTKRYDWTFAFCGVCLFASGAMLFLIPWLVNKRNKGDKKFPKTRIFQIDNNRRDFEVDLNAETQELITQKNAPPKNYEAV